MNNLKKIFFTSDTHYFHENCIVFDKRPFRDIQHMNEALVNNFNSTVPKDGVTYFLGDISMGMAEESRELINRLNGTKILVLGNHDRGHNAMYNMGFDVVLNAASLQIASEIVTLSHCPLRGIFREETSGMKGTKNERWHGESRANAIKYSVTDHGQFHLSGHIHSPNGGKSIRTLIRQLDVGVVANNFRPLSIHAVEKWICDTKPLVNDWRDVVGFPGYKVNYFGEIKTFKRYKEGKYLSPYKDKDGYLCISIRVNNESKGLKLHRIVAEAFLPNDKELPQVNHKNGHKFDNSARNLEWISNIDNQRHAWNNDLKTVQLTVSQVSDIKRMIIDNKTNKEISSIYQVDPSLISNIRRGKTWKDVD